MEKFCKFNAAFRLNAETVAAELGLESTTSKRQAENGTLAFYDPRTGATYTLHETGYVRRSYPKNSLNSPWGGETPYVQIYQLNQTRIEKIKYPTFTSSRTHRILVGPYEQLGIFVKSVLKFRGQ